jgi:putative tryptophan/tyrosine transport system permease protein
MTLLLGALTLGLILSLLALGVFISFRVFSFSDITTDGSVTTGAAIAAVLLTDGVSPLWATLAGAAGGALAGAATGTLHAKFRIHRLLAGILVMTALYSVNLRIMGKSNVPLMMADTLATRAQAMGERLAGKTTLELGGYLVGVRDLAVLAVVFVFIVAVAMVLWAFLRTQLGTAMRATGNNEQMIRALGVDVGIMQIIGLALANGLVGLSGALMAQYQGFADVQMGIGMVVWGLASVIIGEALVGSTQLGLVLTGAVMGSVLFRLLVAIALRAGLDPNDLKLVTAVFVFAALVLPGALAKVRARRSTGAPLARPGGSR